MAVSGYTFGIPELVAPARTPSRGRPSLTGESMTTAPAIRSSVWQSRGGQRDQAAHGVSDHDRSTGHVGVVGHGHDLVASSASSEYSSRRSLSPWPDRSMATTR